MQSLTYFARTGCVQYCVLPVKKYCLSSGLERNKTAIVVYGRKNMISSRSIADSFLAALRVLARQLSRVFDLGAARVRDLDQKRCIRFANQIFLLTLVGEIPYVAFTYWIGLPTAAVASAIMGVGYAVGPWLNKRGRHAAASLFYMLWGNLHVVVGVCLTGEESGAAVYFCIMLFAPILLYSPQQKRQLAAAFGITIVAMLLAIPLENASAGWRTLSDEQGDMVRPLMYALVAIMFILFLLAVIQTNQLHARRLARARGRVERLAQARLRTIDEIELRVETELNRRTGAEAQLRARNAELELAKLAALQERMSPHFLLNSLNLINVMLARGRIRQAEDAILALGENYRFFVQWADHALIPFEAEWNFLQKYAAVAAGRAEGRPSVRFRMRGQPDAQLIPPFSLQPLVAESLKRSAFARESSAPLRVLARLRDARLEVLVFDRSSQQTPEKLARALETVRKRLRYFFDRVELTTAAGPRGGIRLRLRLADRRAEPSLGAGDAEVPNLALHGGRDARPAAHGAESGR